MLRQEQLKPKFSGNIIPRALVRHQPLGPAQQNPTIKQHLRRLLTKVAKQLPRSSSSDLGAGAGDQADTRDPVLSSSGISSRAASRRASSSSSSSAAAAGDGGDVPAAASAAAGSITAAQQALSPANVLSAMEDGEGPLTQSWSRRRSTRESLDGGAGGRALSRVPESEVEGLGEEAPRQAPVRGGGGSP
jgi:hypothetical protein